MMLGKQTDANRAELLLRSQLVIISRICISNPIPSCGRREDNNMQMSSSEWEREKRQHDEEQIAEIFFLALDNLGEGPVYLTATDGGEGRVAVQIHSGSIKKKKLIVK